MAATACAPPAACGALAPAPARARRPGRLLRRGMARCRGPYAQGAAIGSPQLDGAIDLSRKSRLRPGVPEGCGQIEHVDSSAELVEPRRVASQGQVSRTNSKLEPIWRTAPRGLAYPVEMSRFDGLHRNKSSGLEIRPRHLVDGRKQRVLETRTEITGQLQTIKVDIHFVESIARQCRADESMGNCPPEAVHEQVVSSGYSPDV